MTLVSLGERERDTFEFEIELNTKLQNQQTTHYYIAPTIYRHDIVKHKQILNLLVLLAAQKGQRSFTLLSNFCLFSHY